MPGVLQSMVSQRVRHDSDWTTTHNRNTGHLLLLHPEVPSILLAVLFPSSEQTSHIWTYSNYAAFSLLSSFSVNTLWPYFNFIYLFKISVLFSEPYADFTTLFYLFLSVILINFRKIRWMHVFSEAFRLSFWGFRNVKYEVRHEQWGMALQKRMQADL